MNHLQSAGAKLRALIETGETILLPGAHDPLTGRVLQRMGFKALQCAGWMTAAHLTTPEPVMTMTEQVEAARRVAHAVDVPIFSDAGTGYGDPIHAMRAVREFEAAGIAMVHIEDQVFPKRASYHRGLEHVVKLDDFLLQLEYALEARRDKDFMIFARTDAGNAEGGSWKEAAKRARAAKAIGVDGILPMTRNRESVERFRQEYPDDDLVMLTTTYYNGMHPEELRKFGFQMICYPLATIVSSVAAVTQLYRGVQETGIAAMDPELARITREEVEAAIGLPEFWEIEKATVESASQSYEGKTNAGYEGAEQKKVAGGHA
ncbi:isocitrate lyase/PEP mutase family protein [Candidimonas nitroreducens]|nr:isocitrate lyase/PEP mutase family protein [Candidimonas nitroreducens]